MRLSAMLGVTAAVMVASASVIPAQAKGLAGGVIEGEGLTEPIVIGRGDGDRQYPVDEMWEDFGLYPAVLGFPATEGQRPAVLLDRPPTTDLGPELTATWTVPGPGGEREVVQTLYPDASGGPLVFTAEGQPVMGDDATKGGWFRAGSRLAGNLQALGVPLRPASAGPAPASGDASTGDGGAPWLVPLAATLTFMLLLGCGSVLVARRRRVSPAAI